MSSTGGEPKTTDAIDRIRLYLAMLADKPITQNGDVIHAIYTCTKWEAELLLSDIHIVIEAINHART